MTDKKYESKIEFLENNILEIEVTYEVPITRKDVESLLRYFQYRFSQKTGKQVPIEEIEVSPKEGELRQETTSFRVNNLTDSLYLGLKYLHIQAPYVLPNLIDDLRKYTEESDIGPDKADIIITTIQKLEEIVGDKEDY